MTPWLLAGWLATAAAQDAPPSTQPPPSGVPEVAAPVADRVLTPAADAPTDAPAPVETPPAFESSDVAAPVDEPAPSEAPAVRRPKIDTAPPGRRRPLRRRLDTSPWGAVVPPTTVAPVPAVSAPVPSAPPPSPSLPSLQGWASAVPARGVGAALVFAVLALVAKLIARGASRLRPRLRERGILPSTLRAVVSVGRALAGLLALAAVVAVVPDAWLPVLVLVLVLAALVVVWSLRQATRDVVCGVIVLLEGRPAPGMLLHVDGAVCMVEAVRLRVTWVRDEDGARVAIANSRLVSRDVRIEDGRYPEVTTSLHLPWSGPSEVVRERVMEAALVSPWRAPGAQPVVRRGEDTGDWVVIVRVLDVRFARDHREAVREVALEALGLDEVAIG